MQIVGSPAAQVNFHTTVSGQAMMTMIYHRKLDEVWTAAAQKLRKVLGACPSSTQPSVHIIGRSRKQKIELDAGHVIETLDVGDRQLIYKQVCLLLHRSLYTSILPSHIAAPMQSPTACTTPRLTGISLYSERLLIPGQTQKLSACYTVQKTL